MKGVAMSSASEKLGTTLYQFLEAVELPETKGTVTIAKSNVLFSAYLDSKFRYKKTDVSGPDTKPAIAQI